MNYVLVQAVIYLLAAVIAVPIAKRLGLGSVLGYLIAGLVIGPIFGWVGSETADIQHFAEFGVVMMLFLVGLELEPERLWRMRRRLIGLGGSQILFTALLIGGGAFLVLGMYWSVSIAIGVTLAMSSTAIVLQTLSEKGLSKTEGGEAAFSVLLLQDIAVIPILALLPMLAMPELVAELAHADAHGDGHGAGHPDTMIASLSPWARALATVGAVGIVVIVGQYLTRPVFRVIAATDLREMFTAASLLFVIGIAVLMSAVGLSPALGTFLGGVVLANSEYRHELESDIEPFKGLLLGLFFITVGSGIDLTVLANEWVVILSLTLLVMLIKGGVLYAIGKASKLNTQANILFALSLAQAGEFGFVLTGISLQNGVVSAEHGQLLLLVIAISMFLTPLLFIVYDKLVLKIGTEGSERESDEINTTGVAIIAGHGRFGQVINRMLKLNGFDTVLLDHDYSSVDRVRKFGLPVYYGDASRPELLEAAGLKEAALLIIAIDDADRIVEMVKYVRQVNSNIHIIARAIDRHEVYKLFQAGANDIIQDTFDSSVRAGRSALEALGYDAYKAERASKAYVKWDRKLLRDLAEVFDPDIPVHLNKPYVEKAKKIVAEIDAATTGAGNVLGADVERSWRPPPPMKTEIAQKLDDDA